MAQTWSRSTLVSHEAASARRKLRVVGGSRFALIVDALGVAAPLEQRSSPESPSSSSSQLPRLSGFGEAAAGLGRLDGEWRHVAPPLEA